MTSASNPSHARRRRAPEPEKARPGAGAVRGPIVPRTARRPILVKGPSTRQRRGLGRRRLRGGVRAGCRGRGRGRRRRAHGDGGPRRLGLVGRERPPVVAGSRRFGVCGEPGAVESGQLLGAFERAAVFRLGVASAWGAVVSAGVPPVEPAGRRRSGRRAEEHDGNHRRPGRHREFPFPWDGRSVADPSARDPGPVGVRRADVNYAPRSRPAPGSPPGEPRTPPAPPRVARRPPRGDRPEVQHSERLRIGTVVAVLDRLGPAGRAIPAHFEVRVNHPPRPSRRTRPRAKADPSSLGGQTVGRVSRPNGASSRLTARADPIGHTVRKNYKVYSAESDSFLTNADFHAPKPLRFSDEGGPGPRGGTYDGFTGSDASGRLHPPCARPPPLDRVKRRGGEGRWSRRADDACACW